MKVLVSTPCYNHSLDSRMVGSFLEVLKHFREAGDGIEWDRPSSPLLAYNRNVSAQKAIDENYDWLLYWDADTAVRGGDFIHKMIETAFKQDAFVVGAPVRLKTVLEKKWNFAVKQVDKYVNWTGELPVLPFEVDVVGTGVMLLKPMVLKDMKHPFFTITDTFNEKPGFFPEDWGFCEKVKEKGEKIVLDPRIHTSHYGTYGYE